MFERIRKTMKDNRGSEIFQFIIIIAIVAIIAVVALPELNNKITEKASTSIDRMDDLDEILD